MFSESPLLASGGLPAVPGSWASAAAAHTAAQDRSRSPTGNRVAAFVGASPKSEVVVNVLSGGSASGGTGQVAWTTGDKVLDHWVVSFIFDPAILQRLGMIRDLPERNKLVRNCRDNVHRIRCMNAWMNGCIAKSLKAQSLLKPDAAGAHSRSPLPVASVARPSFPPGMGNAGATLSPSMTSSHASSGNVSADEISESRRGALSATAVRLAAAGDNEIVSEWQAWSLVVMRSAERKSKFLREVLQTLDPSVAGTICGLPSEWQFVLAASVALLARNGQSPLQTAPLLLRSYAETLGNQSIQVPDTVSAGQTIKLVLIHYGALCGMSHIAVRAALTSMLEFDRNLHVEVLEAHSFPSSAGGHAVEQFCISELNLRAQTLPDTSHWPRLCLERKQFWASQGVSLVVLHAVDATEAEASKEGDLFGASLSLHSAYSASFWRPLSGLRHVSPEIPPKKVSLISWNIAEWQCLPGDRLDEWLGPESRAEPFNYRSPQAMFSFRASPALPVVAGKCAGTDTNAAVDGWRWLPSVHKHSRKDLKRGPWSPPVLSLFDIVVFKERELESCEQQALHALQRVHQESGKVVLFDLPRVMAFLGVENMAVGRGLLQHFPCYGHILRTTGSSCAESSSLAEPCRQHRWCLNCEQAVRLLFCSPHIGMLTDYVSAWLHTVLRTAIDPNASAVTVDFRAVPDHKCVHQCKGIPGSSVPISPAAEDTAVPDAAEGL